MSTLMASTSESGSVARGRRLRAAVACFAFFLASCGGGDTPPPAGGTVAVVPVISQQPVDVSVLSGQPASFTVAATGTAPLMYQWQRNGVTIAGATSATYALADTASSDNGAVFRAVVSDAAGSVTSNGAVLTVTTAPPVLTITQQPADVVSSGGAAATFTVAATCSTGSLDVQWQRSSGTAGSFVAITGATAASYTLAAPGRVDSGALFQAVLDCSGQSTVTSRAGMLTVSAPSSATLDVFPVVGLRDQAVISKSVDLPDYSVIDQEANGSYVFSTGYLIKRLSADLSTISLVAGGGLGSVDGVGAAASFNDVSGLTHDAAGNVFVADSGNGTIRRIAPDGTVTTIAGLANGIPDNVDGTGSAARFHFPTGLAIGPDGDLYVADTQNHRIRRVTPAGVVTTYAGSSSGYKDAASALAAQFQFPSALAVAANGDIFVADRSNNRIRRILRSGDSAGAVQTLAGNGLIDPSSPDGVGTGAAIDEPGGLALRGNVLTVRDSAGLLRQVDTATAVVTTLTGSHAASGFADGPPSAARLNKAGATGLTLAANGGFMIADTAIRLVSASGDVSTIASQRAADLSNSTDTSDGAGVLAQLPLGRRVVDVLVDASGRIAFADAGAKVVRRIDASGQVSLVAGLAYATQGIVDGAGSAAQFGEIEANAIAQDTAGNLYVGDFAAVRKIGPDGSVSLLAGSRATDSSALGAVDGNAATARFNVIGGLAVGPDGAVYVSDPFNNAVRRVDGAGNVTTYAGVLGQSGSADGPMASARLVRPGSLAFGPDGSLYVSDAGQLRRISADATTVSTFTGLGTYASGQVFDRDGTLYFAASTGLWSLSPGATTATLLIPGNAGDMLVLGATPHLQGTYSLAVLGPRQLLVVSGGQLLKVSLP